MVEPFLKKFFFAKIHRAERYSSKTEFTCLIRRVSSNLATFYTQQCNLKNALLSSSVELFCCCREASTKKRNRWMITWS